MIRSNIYLPTSNGVLDESIYLSTLWVWVVEFLMFNVVGLNIYTVSHKNVQFLF